MSVLIKGMKMPKNCMECAIRSWTEDEWDVCPFSGIMALNIGRQNDCPLVEVPTPHGRLIDERVAEQCIGDHMVGIAGREGRSDWQRVHDGLADTPTVIEAEREKEEHDE